MPDFALLDVGGNVVGKFIGIELEEAEKYLAEIVDDGVDVRLGLFNPPLIETAIKKSMAEKPELQGVIEYYMDKGLSKDDILHLIRIGLCQPRFYKPEIWRRSKALMDKLVCPLGLAYADHDGRGKGKYSTDYDIGDITYEIQQMLCRKD